MHYTQMYTHYTYTYTRTHVYMIGVPDKNKQITLQILKYAIHAAPL